MITDRLEVRDSNERGRGVFARVPIDEGEIIEECPVIVIPPEQLDALGGTILHEYFFQWGGTRDAGAIALGYGSLYNHAHDPNAMYVRRLEARLLVFHALRAIAPGDEITVSYHGGFGDRSPVWFDVR